MREDQLPEALRDSMFGPDKLYMASRAYILFLKGMFSAWPSERFRWSPDEEKSNIVICHGLPVQPKVDTKLPILAVSTADTAWQGAGANQQMGGDPFDQGRAFTWNDIAPSSAMICAIASNDTEAGLLGWNIFCAIPAFRDLLAEPGGMDYVDHRPSLSPVFDAVQLVVGARPGQWWATRVVSPFRITQQLYRPDNLALRNAMTAIHTFFHPAPERRSEV